jgi:hypothetical protein
MQNPTSAEEIHARTEFGCPSSILSTIRKAVLIPHICYYLFLINSKKKLPNRSKFNELFPMLEV